MRESSSSHLMVTRMGPRGDSCSSSTMAAIPTAAACLLRRNQVLSPARLSINILLNTPIADLERTCSYSNERDSLPVACPITLLPYRNSGEHRSMMFSTALITFCGSSEGLTGASTFTSIGDPIAGFFNPCSPLQASLLQYHMRVALAGQA